MKIILTILLVCFLHSASAKTYYFSSISGDDSRTSTQAQNSSTPWKTLSKLNSFFSSLQPGDFVLFKRGETFYGSITLNKSGTASAPITISEYGTGSRPVITSLVTLTGWKANSTYSGVYESAANSAFDAAVNIVLLNGVQKGIGRYPNANTPNKGYLTLESHVSNTSITDNQLSASPNWTGADVVIRSTRWTLEKGAITSHSGTKISYAASGNFGVKDDYGYFIQNHIKTLDRLGEWYYNPSTKKISMYFGANNPSSYVIQAATNENLVYSLNRSYVVFDNITFKGANANELDINNGINNYVSNCEILFSGRDGVKASVTNFKLENSNILNSNNDGVNVSSGSAPIVRNNIIKNSYTIAGMGQGGNGSGAGVRNTAGGLVEYNQIINSGYLGVQLGGDYAIIKNNLIDSFCFVKDDGAGVYTSNGDNNTYRGRKITGNIILNAIGAAAGANSSGFSAEGIYMDDNTNGVEITGNTIANCNRGIYFHNTRNIIAKGNTIYNNISGQLFMKHDALAGPLRDHTITNNIFFSKLSKHIVASFTSRVDDMASIGTLDNNYYARPMDDQITIYNNIYYLTPGQVVYHRDLEQWSTKYGHDEASKRSAKKIAPYKLKGLIGSNKYANGAFNSTENVHENKCVASWSKAGVMDGGYLKVVPSDEGSSIVLGIGALTAGKNYLLRYSLKSTGTLSLAANLRSASYSPNTPYIRRRASTTRTENEILFSPSTNESSGSLVFTADAKTTYYLDNIKLYEATATKTNPDDSIRFEYNATKVPKTVSLNGNYVDVKNKKYSNSIVLQPYASAILIKDGSAISTPENISPTVSITDPVKNENFTGPATINLEASANDKDGSISKVEFYNGTTLLATENYAPYVYKWEKVPEGIYTLIAKAYDNSGKVTTSAVVPVSVVSPNAAPTVRITKPSNNISVAGPATISIEAIADDEDGTISKVEFYNGLTLLATENYEPYTYIWEDVPAGNYILTAKATDNKGKVTTSAGIRVTVETQNAPTIRLTNPDNNTSYDAPATINISAAAADKDGTISKVEFYNGTTLLVTENYAPYTYAWEDVPEGDYTLRAKATDNDGNVTTSASIRVSVAIQNAPTVSIKNPDNNTSYTGPATINMDATATDEDGTISKVEFYAGATLLHTEYYEPYTYAWNDVPLGVYTLTAKATDDNGNLTTSAGVRVSVVPENIAPTVKIINPKNNKSYTGPATIKMEAIADDEDGTISKVEFYNGTTLLHTEYLAPYTYTWEDVPAGNYIIIAKAKDNNGKLTTSAGINISVEIPQSVSIITPTNNANFNAPAAINITASATVADGGIDKVQFYNGTTLIATQNYFPYAFTWYPVQAGTYNLTAKAIYNSGVVVTSTNVSVLVENTTTLSSISPDNNELLSVTNDGNAAYSNQTMVNSLDPPKLLDFRLFPNPAINKIQVSFDDGIRRNQKANLAILNLSGNTLKSIPIILTGNKIEVDISSLNIGVYIMRISGDNFLVNKKFTKIN